MHGFNQYIFCDLVLINVLPTSIEGKTNLASQMLVVKAVARSLQEEKNIKCAGSLNGRRLDLANHPTNSVQTALDINGAAGKRKQCHLLICSGKQAVKKLQDITTLCSKKEQTCGKERHCMHVSDHIQILNIFSMSDRYVKCQVGVQCRSKNRETDYNTKQDMFICLPLEDCNMPGSRRHNMHNKNTHRDTLHWQVMHNFQEEMCIG